MENTVATTTTSTATPSDDQIVLTCFNLEPKILQLNADLLSCIKVFFPSGSNFQSSTEDIEQHLFSFFNSAKELETAFIQLKDQIHRADEALRLKEDIKTLEDELRRKTALVSKYTRKIDDWETEFRALKDKNEIQLLKLAS
eukprot:TRINITY_DN7811_c0_g1_i1.p1 TRINITY_DN7811_c0_g1~~TRINITY_DN7811_c0_g1_i1.p1  ORF type:complete len:151 (+),score=41.67 TRINITY_DN7811_c0_g1_i1:29-454(+)